MKKSLKIVIAALVTLIVTSCVTNNNSQNNADTEIAGPAFVLFYTENWVPWQQFAPIVDGLEAEYGEQVNFVRLNVEIPENERVQQSYGLRGHPSVAILDADGVMVQDVFGAETAVNLRTYLDQITP